jgi:hypothetical protein
VYPTCAAAAAHIAPAQLPRAPSLPLTRPPHPLTALSHPLTHSYPSTHTHPLTPTHTTRTRQESGSAANGDAFRDAILSSLGGATHVSLSSGGAAAYGHVFCSKGSDAYLVMHHIYYRKALPGAGGGGGGGAIALAGNRACAGLALGSGFKKALGTKSIVTTALKFVAHVSVLLRLLFVRACVVVAECMRAMHE